MQFQQELLDAVDIAKHAGDIILKYYASDYAVYEKENKSPVTEADLAANEYIIAELKKVSPHPILSEETKDDISRMNSDFLWIVDPLDGTKEFLNKTGEFSVMIGLAYKEVPLLGVVYQPTTKKCYIAEKGKGAYIKIQDEYIPLHVSTKQDSKDMTVVISRSHMKEEDKQIAAELTAKSFKQSGSVGIKIGIIAEQEADLYYNISPHTSEWDTCAPEIIIQEAGGKLTDMHGTLLKYNQKEVQRLNGIASSNGLIHNTLVKAIKKITT
jgi:3'(2'), 5'-bisphosphate nucleotidase